MLIHFLYRDEPTLARFQSGLVTLGDVAEARRSPRSSCRSPRRLAPGRDDEPLGTAARARRRLDRDVLERRVGVDVDARSRTVSGGTHGFFRWHGTLPRGTVVRVHAGALVGAPLTIT